MARRGRTRIRTRTVTKIRTRRLSGLRSRARSFRSRHSGKVDHAVLLTAGAGAGAITTTLMQIARKQGINIPAWADLVASGITGFLTGRHISKNNMKAVESSIAGVATSYLENKVLSGQALLSLNLNNGSSQNNQGVVY